MAADDSFESLIKSGAQSVDDQPTRKFPVGPLPAPVAGDVAQGETPEDSTDFGFQHVEAFDDLLDVQTLDSQVFADTCATEEADRGVEPNADKPVALSDYNRVLFEARLQGVGDAELKYPWESGVMGKIFSDDDMDLPGLSHFPFEYLGIEHSGDASSGAGTSTDVALSSVHTKLDLPCYSFAIKVRPDMDMQQLTDALWIKSISKWHQVFEVLGFPGVLGSAVEFECLYGDASEHGVVLRDALGIKSPRTAIKRAQTRCNISSGFREPIQTGIHGTV